MGNPTKEDALKGLENPMGPYLEAESIDGELLAKKLNEELNAKETKVFSGPKSVIYSKNMIAWPIRQKARQDAHKLRNDYPIEKITLTHDLTEHTKNLLDKIDGQSRTILPSEEED